jgi:hypothetical protein
MQCAGSSLRADDADWALGARRQLSHGGVLPTGRCRPPGPQIAALPSADPASAPDSVALPEVNIFRSQPPGQYYCVCFSTEEEPDP